MSNLHTTIKASCPTCADVDLSPDDVHLKTFAPSGRDFYEFICPVCGELIQKPATDRTVELLRSGGVPETKVFLPIEALDPMRNLGEPLTYDDVLDFHNAMQLTAFMPAELWAW